MRLSLLAAVTLLTALAPTAPAQQVEPVRVLVVGAYHFSNPGLDLNNAEADDVLSPRRQRELAVLNDVLLGFSPTIVAVERQADPPYVYEDFAAFDPEMLAGNRDERVQIGFRLAAAAGLEHVHAIDELPRGEETAYFPFDAVEAFAARNDRSEALARMVDGSTFVARFEAEQETASIPEMLMLMNGPDFTDRFYWEVITMGEGEDQPGAELAARWFLRNAKIFNKLQQVTAPGDRAVVVYGAGHGHWLRELVERAPGYELEPLAPWLEKAVARLRTLVAQGSKLP